MPEMKNWLGEKRQEQEKDFLRGSRQHNEELALTQMFPSGWEIRNLRLDNMESSRVKSVPEYQDIRDD
ncbi:MAG: hypothetical protein P8X98_14205, partial [Woeseiaceae bacterium]